MSKTFDEWWEEEKGSWCWVLNKPETDVQCRMLALITWNASRQNMTYKDI